MKKNSCWKYLKLPLDCKWWHYQQKTLRDISRNAFNSYNRFYAFPCIFNTVAVGFKVMIVELVLLWLKIVDSRFLQSLYSFWYLSFIWGYFAVINFFSKLLLIKMDFWRVGVIQSFVLHFSLNLLTFLTEHVHPRWSSYCYIIIFMLL